jgi:hypothetical protein
MSVRISWGFDPTVSITSFTLTKSTNNGITYAALASVDFDVNGANYDRPTRTFFYVDNAGAAGHVYKIVAEGALGSSEPVISVAPPNPPSKCLVIGYALDAFGQADEHLVVNVETAGRRGQHWLTNPTGLVANNREALGVVRSSCSVFPDANGMWQVSLLRGSYARVQIPALELDWAFEVPSLEGPVNVRDIPLLRSADYLSLWPDMTAAADPLLRS